MGNNSTKPLKSQKIILKKGITPKQKSYILQQSYMRQLYANQTWHIDFANPKRNYTYALSLVECAEEVITLSVTQQPNALFMYDIISVKFPQVRKLTLNQNRITSVEVFTCIRFPCLREISISDNFISSVACLRKMAKDLEILSLKNNFITNLHDDKFYQVSFSDDVDSINIEEQKQFCYDEDIRWLVKLPIINCLRLQVHSKKRMKIPPKLFKMIKDIYGKQTSISLWINRRY